MFSECFCKFFEQLKHLDVDYRTKDILHIFILIFLRVSVTIFDYFPLMHGLTGVAWRLFLIIQWDNAFVCEAVQT